MLPSGRVVCMPVAGKVTAVALQAFIAQRLGVSPDHISLECGTDNVVYNAYMCRETRTPIVRSKPVGDVEVTPDWLHISSRVGYKPIY